MYSPPHLLWVDRHGIYVMNTQIRRLPVSAHVPPRTSTRRTAILHIIHIQIIHGSLPWFWGSNTISFLKTWQFLPHQLSNSLIILASLVILHQRPTLVCGHLECSSCMSAPHWRVCAQDVIYSKRDNYIILLVKLQLISGDCLMCFTMGYCTTHRNDAGEDVEIALHWFGFLCGIQGINLA